VGWGSLGDLIAPAAMVVILCGIVAGLLAHRAAGWAVLLLAALFVLNLAVPSPREMAETAELHLHPFPASLAALMLGAPAIGLAALVGYGTRALVRWLRERRRDGGMTE